MNVPLEPIHDWKVIFRTPQEMVRDTVVLKNKTREEAAAEAAEEAAQMNPPCEDYSVNQLD